MENAILFAFAAFAGLMSSIGLFLSLDGWLARLKTRTSAQPQPDETTPVDADETQPKPEPLTLEMIARGDIDDRLRRLYEDRVAGWDLQWEPEGGSYGSLIGKERMHLKLAAERRMHELAALDEAAAMTPQAAVVEVDDEKLNQEDPLP